MTSTHPTETVRAARHPDGMRWTPLTGALWGKTGRRNGDDPAAWSTLTTHLADTADVMGWLVDHWLADSLLGLLCDQLQLPPERVRRILIGLAFGHDCGKATPGFAALDDTRRRHLSGLGLPARATDAVRSNRTRHFHALASEVLLGRSLVEAGLDKKTARRWAQIVGAHHGTPWQPSDADDVLPTAMGRGPWADAQAEIMAAILAGPHGNPFTGEPAVTVQMLMCGLVIVADWLASMTALFPLDNGQPVDRQQRTRQALQTLALPGRWTPTSIPDDNDELFGRRVQRRPQDQMRPSQHGIVTAARSLPGPGLLIYEARPGEGKTEGALLAAEIMASRFGCSGILFALPTRATADAIFDRLLDWAGRLPGVTGADLAIHLGHGKAHLNQAAQQLAKIEDASDPATQPAHVHPFLAGHRKLAPLAHLDVTTIDQPLLGGKQMPHQMLRHLAFAGKVNVIDEVHAYDTHMNAFLDSYLSWMGAYRTPVILLSATLPSGRRQQLIDAYTGGRATHTTGPHGYPLITSVPAEGGTPRHTQAAAAGPRSTVHVAFIGDQIDVAVAAARQGIADGGNVLVIRNTVGRCIEFAKAAVAAGQPADRLLVVHSRFTDSDRARLDQRLVGLFGDTSNRPQGHLVVATQVAEQSLNIDFDLLITDVAPLDALLQRIGRLHRFPHLPRSLPQAHCLITGVDHRTLTAPLFPRVFGGTIYDEYTLLRAVEQLTGRRQITLPDDIRPLIEAAYGDTIHPGPLRDRLRQALDDRRNADLTTGWTVAGFTLPTPHTCQAQRAPFPYAFRHATPGGLGVRDTAPQLEVVLVERHLDGTLTIPTWAYDDPGLPIPDLPRLPPDVRAAVERHTIRLPRRHAPNGPLHQQLAAQTRWGGGTIPLPLPLDADRRAHLAGTHFHYHPLYGLIETSAP